EGMVLSILVHASALGREINIDLARKVLSHSVKVSKRTVNFDTITQKVAGYYDIDPDLIFSKSRKREISDARQMVMYMAKKHAKMPLKTIGTRLARTHATVIYACNNIEQRLPIEKQLQNDVSAIESQLLG
ncbi:MAG: chromosomal replication initiator protein DnaA, partial [Paramuribaculum sp.]|nr:chromosomal replication initiator protein DnaA [Paramuribaculum sp.]